MNASRVGRLCRVIAENALIVIVVVVGFILPQLWRILFGKK